EMSHGRQIPNRRHVFFQWRETLRVQLAGQFVSYFRHCWPAGALLAEPDRDFIISGGPGMVLTRARGPGPNWGAGPPTHTDPTLSIGIVTFRLAIVMDPGHQSGVRGKLSLNARQLEYFSASHAILAGQIRSQLGEFQLALIALARQLRSLLPARFNYAG